MGICGSTNQKSTKQIRNQSDGGNYKTSYANSPKKARGESVNNYNDAQQKKDTAVVRGLKYPSGKCFLLKRAQLQNQTEITDLKQRVELFITILNDANLNEGFKVKIEIGQSETQNYTLLGETQFSNPEPSFIYPTSLELDYYFEKMQPIRITVTSSGNSVNKVKDSTIGAIMGGRKNTLSYKEDEFTLNIMANSIKNDKLNILLNLQVPNFSEGKTYYYILSNFNDKSTWRKVYKSEERKVGETWDTLEVDSGAVCLGDFNNNAMVEIYETQAHTLVDSSSFVIAQAVDKQSIPLQNSQINVPVKIETVKQMNFVELLYSGLQISLVVCVDFTASNGNITLPNSLHYLYGSEPNDYERAIRSCGNILAYYDYDQMFPLLGFGGLPQGFSVVEHSFPLNYQFQGNPCVNGIEEMINTYKSALSNTQLYGPTYFAPMLRNIVSLVKGQKDPKIYIIVMILTDGEINDMAESVDAIIQCSYMPISIVIVGIGKANFENMKTLDGDDIPLSSNNRIVQRDIVQFVEFKKYEGNSQKLAEEILKEVPKQVEDYYRINRNFK